MPPGAAGARAPQAAERRARGAGRDGTNDDGRPRPHRNEGLRTMLRFFDATRAVSFGKSIADEFCKVHALRDHNKKHLGRKGERTVALVRKASAFARAEKLNFYTRAKMLAEIKQGLKNAGVDEAETEDFVRAIVMERLRPAAPG